MTRGARYTLQTDISNFYPSIYTHAVDWAIRGKSVAKGDRSLRSTGAKIDKALRNQNDGQTSGICIGPDTSWLIGEVLLASIDAEFCRIMPQASRHAHRWYDDITFYAQTLGDAERALAAYERLLMEFEMSLNPAKTSIKKGIWLQDSNSWLIKMRQARYRDDSSTHLAGDVMDLFTIAFETASDNATTGAISYAIKRCNPFPGGEAWKTYQQLLLTSATLEPSCLPHVRDVLLFAYGVGLPLDRDGIAESMNDICSTHAPQDHGFEVAWALSIMRELAIRVDSASAREVAGMSDNFSLLLLLDAWNKSKSLRRSVDVDPVVKNAESSDALSTDDWLLAYESRVRKWCRPVGFKAAPAWRELRDAKVRFLTLTVSTRRIKIRRARPSFLSIWPYA